MYQYKSNDGLCQSNDYDAINLWNNIVLEQKSKDKIWIEKLRENNVKAAHPDDGWVNRENNSVIFAYPRFNDDVKVNDIIALGWEDGYRLVKVIDIKNEHFTDDRYYFVDI